MSQSGRSLLPPTQIPVTAEIKAGMERQRNDWMKPHLYRIYRNKTTAVAKIRAQIKIKTSFT